MSLAIRAVLRAMRSSEATDDGGSSAWRRKRAMDPTMVARGLRRSCPTIPMDLLLEFHVLARHLEIVPLGSHIAQGDDYVFDLVSRVAQPRGLREQSGAAGVGLDAHLAVKHGRLPGRVSHERRRVSLAASVNAPPALFLEPRSEQRLARMAEDALGCVVDELHPPRRVDHEQSFLDGFDEPRERLLLGGGITEEVPDKDVCLCNVPERLALVGHVYRDDAN